MRQQPGTIQIGGSSLSSGQITNYPNQVQGGILTGQATTGSIILSENQRLAGSYPPNEIPKDPNWVKDNGGYPDNNPKTALGSKKLPLEVVPPSAMHALAEAFADGANKYGSYNWRSKTVSSSIYYAAALRHMQAWWDGEDVASDSRIHHLHHALACLAIVVDAGSIGKLNDNRPPKGAAADMQRAWLKGTDGKG